MSNVTLTYDTRHTLRHLISQARKNAVGEPPDVLKCGHPVPDGRKRGDGRIYCSACVRERKRKYRQNPDFRAHEYELRRLREGGGQRDLAEVCCEAESCDTIFRQRTTTQRFCSQTCRSRERARRFRLAHHNDPVWRERKRATERESYHRTKVVRSRCDTGCRLLYTIVKGGKPVEVCRSCGHEQSTKRRAA